MPTNDIQKLLEKDLVDLMENLADGLNVIGPPGCGKTQLAISMVEFFKSYGVPVIFLAPTGPACEVLARRTGAQVKTIHSEIYTYDEDQSTEYQTVFKLKDLRSDGPRVVICDEASMIPDQMQKSSGLMFGSGGFVLTDLFEAFGPETKFIFLGDKNQLPPAFCNTSPALDPEYLEAKFSKRVRVLELTGNWRTESQDILNFAKQFISKR